jgi:spermidine synthase
LFTLFCSEFKDKSKNPVASVYYLDAIGSIIGGVLFGFVFILFLNPFQILFVMIIINLVSAFMLSAHFKKKIIAVVITVLLMVSTALLFIDFDKITSSFQYGKEGLILQKDSKYGRLTVTRSESQLNFYENSLPLFSTGNIELNEETVHYPLSQHKNPKNILLIGGAVKGTAIEAQKYNLSRIDYLELDTLLIEIGKKYTSNLKSEKIKVINKDAKLFLKNTKQKYDVIIIDVSDPSTLQLNRFYTQEFFQLLKNNLNKNGILSLAIISTPDYISEQSKKINSILFKTLKTQFNNVMIIPGSRNFFIASDFELSYDISKKLELKNISTKYVNAFYLNAMLTQDRISSINNNLEKNAALNKDFYPTLTFAYQSYWSNYFKINYLLIAVIVLTAIILFVLRLKPITFALFTSGLSASGIQLILISSFQILYGYVYASISILIASFMIGLAVGSIVMKNMLKKISIKDLKKIQTFIAIYLAFLPLVIILLHNHALTDFFLHIVFSILAFIPAFLVGMQFPLASKHDSSNPAMTSAHLYSSDLIGAAIGSLLVTAFLIPLIGIFYTCSILFLLNIVSIIILHLFFRA